MYISVNVYVYTMCYELGENVHCNVCLCVCVCVCVCVSNKGVLCGRVCVLKTMPTVVQFGYG